MESQFKNLAENLPRVLEIVDMVANGSLVAVNLKVVPAGFCLVAEEVNFFELSWRDA